VPDRSELKLEITPDSYRRQHRTEAAEGTAAYPSSDPRSGSARLLSGEAGRSRRSPRRCARRTETPASSCSRFSSSWSRPTADEAEAVESSRRPPARPTFSSRCRRIEPRRRCHLDVRVAVVAVADLGARPEQSVRLVKEEDRAVSLGGVEDPAQILLGLADVLAHDARDVDPVEVEGSGARRGSRRPSSRRRAPPAPPSPRSFLAATG
jgi:hypothetical protein